MLLASRFKEKDLKTSKLAASSRVTAWLEVCTGVVWFNGAGVYCMDRRILLLGLLRMQEMHGYQLNDFIDRRMKVFLF